MNIEVQISWPAQDFLNLKLCRFRGKPSTLWILQISWQVQGFVNLKCKPSLTAPPPEVMGRPEFVGERVQGAKALPAVKTKLFR